MFSMLLSIALAQAADDGGYRCSAVWTGPAPGCPIEGWMTAEATRRSLPAAERAARKQLAHLLESTAQDLSEHTSSHGTVDYLLCAQTALNDVTVQCTEDSAMRDGGLCFVTFDDDECWDGTVYTFETTGWRSMAAGRRSMCDAVDEALVAQNWSDVEETRAECAERCLIETQVRCPSE